MPFEINALPEISAIEIRMSGKLTIEELRSLTVEVTALAKRTGLRRALADCRDYEGGASLGELYFLTKDLTERAPRVRGPEAIIAPKSPRAAADVEFYAMAARNRGSNVWVFATREAAIEWLRYDGRADSRRPAEPNEPRRR
jgi:hypothetical protein